MNGALEKRLQDLAAKQGEWSLTLGEPRMTFYSNELLPLWEIVEALQQTRGESYRYAELAGPSGYFSGAFVESRFVVVAEGKSLIAEVTETRRGLNKAAEDRDGLTMPKTTESLELFFVASPSSLSSPRTA